ncbi:MAG: malate dehydrogenase [Candidatus Bathyarchaeota archaeon]|nr:malate dehydrogenase [Candidatus Termiticorpusculum sp.]
MITIIGAGKVGSAAAFEILRYKISDVTLIDVSKDLAQGEAMDMIQAAPAIEFDGKITGSNNFEDMRGSELVIVTAGQGRKPSMSRTDLLNTNVKIVSDITKQVARYAPGAKLMMVTNPVDVLTYVAYRSTGFPRQRIFGMGNILDAMRFCTYLSEQCNVSRKDIRALVIGEHGETMVPLIEYASVSGIPIKDFMAQEQIDIAACQTVTSGQEVIALKGATTFAPSTAIAVMADAILTGRNLVLSATTPLEGEYGLSGLSIGVPVILGRGGIEKIIELKLSTESKERLDLSAQSIKTALKTLELD